MEISRIWCMPNSETFKIKPIKELISRYIDKEKIWVDPFVRNSIYKEHCKYTNDLNQEITATHNLEALEFLKQIETETCDGVLFDPPYSFRQIMECYNGIGRKVFQTDTNGSFYADKKIEIARIVKKGGLVISFGWNSMGIGKTRGFEMIELLLVPHGGSKNDTIVTVERKL
jgi:hypothetical protein